MFNIKALTKKHYAKLDTITTLDLKYDKSRPSGDRFVEIQIPAKPSIIERPTQLLLNAEDGRGFANYYPEMSDDPHINSELEQWAAEIDCFWEWENPGCCVLCEN